MHVHYFVLLLILSWICYSDALVNKKMGAKQEQNKNDPKYQKMANQLVHSHLHIKDKDLQNVTVNKVTSQVFSGTITTLQLQVFLKNGKSSKCQFKILDQKWKAVKYVSHKCDSLYYGKKLSLGKNPRAKSFRDPKNPKYKKMAELFIDTFFKNPGYKPFKREDIMKFFVRSVEVNIDSKIDTVVTFSVVTFKNEHFKCTSVHTEIPWLAERSEKVTNTKCTKDVGKSENQPGREEPQNPQNPKYDKLAKKSFESYLQSHGNIPYRYLKVIKVTTQVVVGVITRMDFKVFPSRGESFFCHSEIIEQKPISHKVINITCDKIKSPPIPGSKIPDVANNLNLEHLVKESFQKFQETNGIIKVKDLKINQVVVGKVIRIMFTVIPQKGSPFPCKSEIVLEKGTQQKNIQVTCKKEKHSHVTRREVIQNPLDPKYKNLAFISISKYEKKNGFFDIKELKVTKVTTQVVSGTITLIDFNVITTKGQSFPCHSEILEKMSFRHKYITVTCKNQDNALIPGKEVPQNPADSKYKQLAEEAFEKFQETYGTIRVKEFKVTKVTTQVVSGIITKILFVVISTEGQSFSCNSEIIQNNFKRIKVNCDKQDNDSIPGGEIPQNPDNPKYKPLAEEAFEKFQETYGTIRVKEFKVTKVTTQVVSEIITKILFVVISTEGQSFSCNSEIIQNNFKRIKVNCEKQDNDSIPGGEIPQNPDNPKYKPLVEEAFEKFQETYGTIRVKEFKVTKVTTQLVSGIITKILFVVISTEGQSFSCHSEIIQNNFKRIKVDCEKRDNDSIPGGEIPQNPDNPKYKPLAEEAFEKFQETYGTIRVKEFKVTKVTTQVVSGIITKILFVVISTEGQSFSCHSEIIQNNFKRIKVNCEKQDNDSIPGGEIPQNPDDPKYKPLAEEAFEKFQETYGTIRVKKFKVTKVTTQVVSGIITKILFVVISTEGQSFSCHSEITQNNYKRIKVNCEKQDNDSIPGGEIPQNPDNPKYKPLAEEAFEKFQETYGTLRVKELKVTKVTTQVVSGIITKILFVVISTEGQSFSCHSEIIQNNFKRIKVNCEKQDNDSIPGGDIPQNPDNPKYKPLAEEAFEKFQETYGTIRVKEFKVTKVTTQVVSGIITKIQFVVISTEGQSFSCHSEIIQNNFKIIKVNCEKQDNDSIPGDEILQNPENPKYNSLAEEAFEKFQETYGTIRVKEFKVTKVTTQVVSGIITKIQFVVISTEGQSFSCNSEITQNNYKRIKVNCEKQDNDSIPGGEIPQNPDNSKYKPLAEEAFEKFQGTYGTIRVKEFKVTKVTTQVVSGIITKIQFVVISTEGQSFSCLSEIIQNNFKRIKVNCEKKENNPIPGGKILQNPDNPKYKQLAEEAFKKFQETYYATLTTKEFKVTKVTTQVVSGVITRIHFDVTSILGLSFTCYSEILQKNSASIKNIIITCEKLEHAKTPGGGVPQNPKNPEFKQLAIGAFEKFKETYGTIVITELKVTKVITHTDFIELDFTVISTKGQIFSCNSQSVKQNVIKNKHVTVFCTKQNNPATSDDNTLQNLDDPKYLELAKESFKHFQKYCECSFNRVERYKMTKVIVTQVPSNKRLHTQIDFLVILNSGKSFPCHSDIFEDTWSHAKYLVASCQVPYGLKLMGMSHPIGRSDPEYKFIAKEAINQYFESCLVFRHLQVKQIEIKNVSSVLTSMSQANISYINVQVLTEAVSGNKLLYDCYEVFEEGYNQKPIFTDCLQVNNKNVLTPEQLRDPSDEKYLAFAEKSVQKLSETSKNIGKRSKYEIIVTFVVTMDSKISRAHRIQFVVRMLSGPEYNCSSKVSESFSAKGKNTISDVKCLV